MIFDAEHEVVGRIATRAAKAALLGEKVNIVNCEKAVITGDKKKIIETYKERFNISSRLKGPFWQRRPDKFVRRTVRGMLPYSQERGRSAYKRIHCHIGIPESLKKEHMEKIKKADVSKTHNLKYITIAELCKQLGWK